MRGTQAERPGHERRVPARFAFKLEALGRFGDVDAAAVHVARFADLDAHTLYRILRLRVDVFVVEQHCPYPELDGRDVEPETLHLWVRDDEGEVVCYLRVLSDGEGRSRIGRVVTVPRARGRRLAEQLLRRAVELCAGGSICLEAQSHLQVWYERLGFVTAGEEYVEDGIPHVPMRLETAR